LFRHFGSKVGLFREALVAPFLELVEHFEVTWESGALATLAGDDASRRFLGDLFDRFRANRGIVLTLWGTEAESVAELVDSGVGDEITEGLRRLVDISTGDVGRRKLRSVSDDELSNRTVVAMVAGVALFGQSVFLGRRAPSRDELVGELVQTILHGRAHQAR
jgi:AcrR family transcriptional regulator